MTINDNKARKSSLPKENNKFEKEIDKKKEKLVSDK